MSKLIIAFFICSFFTYSPKEKISRVFENKASTDSIPAYILGDFMDDYGIHYQVTDSLWTQKPGIKYHIIKWNTMDQYIIARNDIDNPADGNLYSRIDFMTFENMQPYLWGFCLTTYNAKNDSIAEFTAKANRLNPKSGCAGYPFSRMKRF